ncbi:MAG: hypothetical protein EBR67_08310 [Proteobacteria bacterium]|nr:hypothetical protein [Pseudomonadota bacterium]
MSYSIIKVSGSDAERFLHSQSSANIKSLPLNNALYAAFLGPKAEIKGLSFVIKPNSEKNTQFLLIVNSTQTANLKQHLEKFIIFDDVQLEILTENLDLNSLEDWLKNKCGETEGLLDSLKNLLLEDFNETDSLIKLDLVEKYFPKDKGCFPGQEVLSKFVNIGLKKRKERSLKYSDEARDLFTRLDIQDYSEIKELLEKAIKENPKNEDAYELLGVIFARENNFQSAIEAMKKLEALNPDSIMAKSNLSIFYMKLGDKETAEDYKAKATVAQFNEALKK